MSELPAGDTHDVISHIGQVVAVVVPIEEYRQLRQAMQEQQVNEEFDAAWAGYLARREAGAIRYVPHGEAGRRLGMPSVQSGLSAACHRGICAGSAPGAAGRASHNPPVVGSSPTRPT